MAEAFIKAMFTCRFCRQEKVSVEVRPRLAGEDILRFMNRVMVRCQACHKARSPRCQGRKLDLYLPMGAEQIGDSGNPSEQRKKEMEQEIKATQEDS